jgi:hypothetical protein
MTTVAVFVLTLLALDLADALVQWWALGRVVRETVKP